jgi:predicted ATPase
MIGTLHCFEGGRRVPQTTTATTLFGRHDELGRAEHDLAIAHSGLPRVLVVSGESGVGKTTLCRNVLARHDGLSLTGHCLPLEGDSVPFAPLIGTLRGLARHLGEPGLQGLERWWPRAFSALLPQEARTAMEGSSPDDELTNSAQARLFEGLLTLLEQLSSAVPVAWLVEDVHWADRSTLDLLTFLAGSLDSGRVLLVITVRTDDLGPEHPTRRWLHELSRLPSVGRLYLTRLGRAATHQQLRALAGADGNAVDASVLDAVFDRSAGNPLFTEELFPWTSDPAQPLPQSLHEMITSRLAMLPADVGPLLEVAAVLGSEVDLDLISQVAGVDEATAEQAVRTAVDRHLLRESAEGTYAFVHPVFREVLETTMLRARRRRLHAAAADALAARCTQPAGFEITARIAHHWEVAGKAGPAYAAAIQAGLAAEQLCAFAEADASFSRAVELGARDDVDPADSGLTPAALLLHAARAAHLVGDDDRAVSITERALQVTDDAAARSEVLERQGMYCFNAGRVEEGNAAFAEALALLPDEPTHARARVLSGIGLLAMGWTRVDEAVRACREAITVARAVGAPKEEGRALNALGVVTAVQGELDEGHRSHPTGGEHRRAARRARRPERRLHQPDTPAVACRPMR